MAKKTVGEEEPTKRKRTSKWKVRYAAREGSPLNNEQANLVGLETEAMRVEGVEVTPANLLARAEDEESSLHDLFEWDNDKAAQSWRINWARTLLGSLVTINVVTRENEKALYSIAIHSEDGDRREYVERSQVMIDGSARSQIAKGLRDRLEAVIKDAESLGLNEDDPLFQRITPVFYASRTAALGATG